MTKKEEFALHAYATKGGEAVYLTRELNDLEMGMNELEHVPTMEKQDTQQWGQMIDYHLNQLLDIVPMKAKGNSLGDRFDTLRQIVDIKQGNEKVGGPIETDFILNGVSIDYDEPTEEDEHYDWLYEMQRDRDDQDETKDWRN